MKKFVIVLMAVSLIYSAYLINIEMQRNNEQKQTPIFQSAPSHLSVHTASNEPNAPRILKFSNYTWYVRPKNIQPQGPGPNYFNDNESSVWVDQNSYLHMKIYNESNKWFCSQIYGEKPYGYGSYVFNVQKGFELIDPRTVVGLFNYLDDTHQIDVQLSQWSDPNIPNTQYAIQPADTKGNLQRFTMTNLNMSVIHAYTWTEKQVIFQTFYANTIEEVQKQIGVISKSERLVKQWTYTGKYIPKASTEKVHINLWLYQGKQPINGKAQEIIIKQFKYIEVKI